MIDKRLTEEEKKKIKPANQGGGPNYLGKQETVTVPKKWLSDPDHVVAELAYITPREQKILLDENLYATTNQYTAPTFVEEDEEGITTMVNNPDFIQRFMVKEPYRQAKGLDFLAQNQAIANMINNLYT